MWTTISATKRAHVLFVCAFCGAVLVPEYGPSFCSSLFRCVKALVPPSCGEVLPQRPLSASLLTLGCSPNLRIPKYGPNSLPLSGAGKPHPAPSLPTPLLAILAGLQNDSIPLTYGLTCFVEHLTHVGLLSLILNLTLEKPASRTQ